jgi:ATP-dependent protease HslVU (ClpYQ) peptidase subunit
MTCIVGIVHKQTVYIGGDSAGVDSSFNKVLRADRKVFVNGPFIMGFTSSFRMGQLLQYGLKPPVKPKLMDDMKFMVTRFMDGVRDCFKNHGFGYITEGEDNEGGDFLVGFNGKLYQVEGNFQVGEALWPYASVGCGANYALGALYATDGMEPDARIRRALEAASVFSAGVAPPFYVLKQSLPLSKKTKK